MRSGERPDTHGGGELLSIQTNSSVLRTNRHLGLTEQVIQKSHERLSTGKRINRAADDPTGMIAATHLEGQEVGLVKKIEALERRQLDFSARDGGLSIVGEQLIELNGLVVSAANTGAASREEREAMQFQADSILKAIDQESFKFLYNGNAVLSNIRTGDMGVIEYEVNDASGTHTGRGSLFELHDGGAFSLINGNLSAAQDSVKEAIDRLNTERGTIGAAQKAMDSETNSLRVELENVQAAKGGIQDTDYAEETSKLVREQVKEQAALAVRQLAQQTRAEAVMALLKPLTLNKPGV